MSGDRQGTGQELWARAKKVIPGGSMVLSKRAEMHLPTGWPAYFQRASGCRVWDLDGREFLDFGLMGVGTNLLGYGHAEVDSAVRNVVDVGNMSTLNAPEEVFLAEALVKLHPWSQMVRFARSGGEACAIAVRIARAASGRDRVAFCGYHSWHDWYLAANLGETSALDGHLLPGLEPRGVPRGLQGTAHPFAFNDLAGLAEILASGEIGVIFMEVTRRREPDPGFLEGVRALADQHGAVLIFDECTSGFRRVLGGTHLDFGVDPDVAVFGKSLGNGYAVSAVVGKEAVMQACQETFISSTFWTERIGSVAGLAALESMRNEDAPRRVEALGRSIQASWTDLGIEHGLEIEISGLPAIAGFAIKGLNPLATKTFITQEMLKRGFLAGQVVYVSIPHEDGDALERYLTAISDVFKELAKFDGDAELMTALVDGTCQSGFSRLA
jgi:glutamate-1-semialdehyde 2,1-aminomutase